MREVYYQMSKLLRLLKLPVFGMERASYFTTEKVDGQFKMKAMCLNLLKAINKVEFVGKMQMLRRGLLNDANL
jgi:IS5 family transposase